MNNWCICWFFMHPLNAELNPISHLPVLLGGANIVVISRLRVNENVFCSTYFRNINIKCYGYPTTGSRELSWSMRTEEGTRRHGKVTVKFRNFANLPNHMGPLLFI